MMTSREFLLLLLVAFVLADDDIKFAGDECQMKDGKSGKCEQIQDCVWFRDNLKARKISYKDVVRCGFEGNVEIICCKNDGTVNRFQDERKSVRACNSFGKYKSGLSFHIIDGVAAEDGEFPFMAALGYKSVAENGTDTIAWNCGASLISDRFLMTAGHCVLKTNQPIIVRLGTNTIIDSPDVFQDFGIKNITSHPEYRSSKNYNDIALIELDKPVVITDTVSPACLNTKKEDYPPTTILSAEGWGVTQTSTRETSPFLQKVNLTTVALPECREKLEPLLKNQRKVSLGILDTQYCAAGTKNEESSGDTCQGDSGGPLQILSGEKYTIIGVVSFGAGCGTEKPSVYTRVSAYLDWIESVVWP